MIALFTAAALAVSTPSPTVAAKEMRDRSLVDLLLGLSVELELGDERAFELRALRHVAPGECDPRQDCAKDRLLVVVATRDEYPEARGFEVPIIGEFRGVAAAGSPDNVRGRFRLIMRSSPRSGDKVVCTQLDVSLATISAKVIACPGV